LHHMVIVEGRTHSPSSSLTHPSSLVLLLRFTSCTSSSRLLLTKSTAKVAATEVT
jgi:hypothetical protein